MHPNAIPVSAAIPNTESRVTGEASRSNTTNCHTDNGKNTTGTSVSKEMRLLFLWGGVFGMWGSSGVFCLVSYIALKTTPIVTMMLETIVAIGAYISFSMANKIIRGRLTPNDKSSATGAGPDVKGQRDE